MHQGRIERFFLDNIKKFSKDTLQVERGVLPESLAIDESRLDDPSAYPVTVKLRHLTEEEATPPQQANASKVPDGLFRSNLLFQDSNEDDELLQKSQARAAATTAAAGSVPDDEVVHAKYVLGCDGARSWTRRALGFELEGEATDFIWGVMDVVPLTDFPDIRMRCAIHSAEHGSLMVIPRENRLVRLYIQLKEVRPVDATGRADRSQITPALIFSSAQRILAPYWLDYEYCDWWTAYQIGQRVGTDFAAHHHRVFLAGDAVHTHSPKAGQGMNISMQDCYNLGWKVALVAKGLARPEILATYQTERRRVAQDLIEFDHRFSRLFSGRPAKDVMDTEGISMEVFRDAFEKGNLFASGLSVHYGPSCLVAKLETGAGDEAGAEGVGADESTSKQALATGLSMGMRFNSFKVLNQADARPWHFQERLKADGRFRVVLFAGDVVQPAQQTRVRAFCAALDAPGSFLRRVTPVGQSLDSVIEVLTIHSAKRTDAELLRDFPAILHPYDEHRGWDYNKVFVDDVSYHEGFGEAYKNYGVNRERGCVVVARPDQYVGWIGELEDVQALEAYFEGCLVLRKAEAVNGESEGV